MKKRECALYSSISKYMRSAMESSFLYTLLTSPKNAIRNSTVINEGIRLAFRCY